MTRANIETKNGMKITLEGEASDIAEIIEDLQDRERRTEERLERIRLFRKEREERLSKSDREERNRLAHGQTSITGILRNLINNGFFDEPKQFKEVARELRKIGIVIPSSTLHPLLSRLTATDNLKRQKGDNDLWEYVKK
jgi:hypothetical protein